MHVWYVLTGTVSPRLTRCPLERDRAVELDPGRNQRMRKDRDVGVVEMQLDLLAAGHLELAGLEARFRMVSHAVAVSAAAPGPASSSTRGEQCGTHSVASRQIVVISQSHDWRR